MEIKLYNNLTRKKEIFKPMVANQLKFYSCGPTTYDYFHVGNARAFVTGDMIHRVFKAIGYDVTYVRNYTDVDDKIINRSQELNVDPLEYSARFVRECEKDMQALGMLPAHFTPKVSECIPEIIQMIQTLIDKNYAYVVDGEVLFHVPQFSDYGKLSKMSLVDLEQGARVEVVAHKKHPSDFVLWKPAKATESAVWDSPWGFGRPGWHIECSAMAKKHLGDKIDLHSGAVDLLFPHHENEIAQSEAANGCPFCDHWVHNEFLNFGSEKMSKSLGNVVTAREFCEKYSGEVLRHIVLSVHYRSKLLWTDEIVKKAIHECVRLAEFQLLFIQKKNQLNASQHFSPKDQLIHLESARAQFLADLCDDFNLPKALSELFLVVKEFNRCAEFDLSKNDLNHLEAFIELVKNATGLLYDHPEQVLIKLNEAKKNLFTQDEAISEEFIEAKIEERKQARREKNYRRSDEIRDELLKSGVVLKDHPDGTVSFTYVEINKA